MKGNQQMCGYVLLIQTLRQVINSPLAESVLFSRWCDILIKEHLGLKKQKWFSTDKPDSHHTPHTSLTWLRPCFLTYHVMSQEVVLYTKGSDLALAISCSPICAFWSLDVYLSGRCVCWQSSAIHMTFMSITFDISTLFSTSRFHLS